MKTKRTVCYAIEPAENGWVVTENVFVEPVAEPLDSDDDDNVDEEGEPGYDPSASFAQQTEKTTAAQTATRESKAYVFARADHDKMMKWLSDRTRPQG